MLSFCMNIDRGCLLCTGFFETHSHLFCECHYSRTILNACPIAVSTVWTDICAGGILVNQVDTIRDNIAYLYVAVAYYHIWAERNLRLHSPGQYNQPIILIRRIKDVVRSKLVVSKLFTRFARQDFTLNSFL